MRCVKPAPRSPSSTSGVRLPVTSTARRAALLRIAAGIGSLAAGVGRAQGSGPRDALVSVPGPGSSVSLPLELAVKLGLDRAAGLPLRLKFVGGGGVMIQDLQGGNAEFAVFGLPAAMEANATGSARLVALAAVQGLPVYTLLARSDLRGTVKSVADLRGRVIGHHNSSLQNRTTAEQLADLIFIRLGLPIESLRFISAGQSFASMSAALVSRSADAVMVDGTLAIQLEEEGLAYRLFSTGVPADAERVPGSGFLRATLIARRDRVEAAPDRAARMVAVVQRTLEWMAGHSPEEMADALAMQGSARQALIAAARRFPQQYSPDGRFSTRQLAETELFFRTANPGLPAAAGFRVADMVIDRWAGRKP
jgi:NitT/TauT family transport system substrate-binding protein